MPKIFRKSKATILFDISIENYRYPYIDIRPAVKRLKSVLRLYQFALIWIAINYIIT